MKMNIDDLEYVLDRTTELVRNADSKNNIMIAIAAGLAAMLFSNEAFLSAIMATVQAGMSLRLIAFCTLVISLIVFLASLFASIWPRDKCSGESLIYAGTIAECQDYHSYKSSLNEREYRLSEDLAHQIYANSEIYSRKTRCNKIAARSLCFLITFILLFVFLFMMGA